MYNGCCLRDAGTEVTVSCSRGWAVWRADDAEPQATFNGHRHRNEKVILVCIGTRASTATHESVILRQESVKRQLSLFSSEEAFGE